MIDIEALVKSIALEREHQMRALRAAMTAILVRGQKGVVLADEVGCGKTYEALAIASLLWKLHHGTDAPVRRILVLANNALIQKWFDEMETAYDASARAARGTQRGFQQYVQDASWQPLVNMMRNVVQLRRAHDGDVRGTREDGRIQVPADRIYLVRPDLLTRGSTQETSTTVRWLKRTKWDVLIIDEAHHFARLNRQISRLFFPEQTTQSRGEGLTARYVLALTATPFQLKVQEILNLLRIIEAPEADIAALSDGLVRYEATLKKFYSRRHLHPSEPARTRVVESLRALRVQNASGGDNPSTPGLESLLRRYLLRNVKDIGQRDYSLVERQDKVVRAKPFGKLDDIQRLVSSSPLIPFDATDRWIYLNVRDLVADALASGVADSSKRTFVSGDLRQMLSSYEQLRASTLVERTDLPRAKQVRALLGAARESRHPHPKVRAICDTVGAILDDEILRMRESPHRLVSKILVFNTMLQTARTLREALEDVVATKLDPFVDESLTAAGFSSRKQVEELIREAVADERETIRDRLRSKFAAEHLMLRPEHVKGTGVAIESGEREIVDVMFDRLINHMIQPMFVLRLARWCVATAMPADIEAVRNFLTLRITERLAASLDRIVDHYLDDTPLQGEAWSEENIERARREIGRLARILAAPQYVGRYDGDVDTDDREMRRENFNRPYAPVVLLVSAVGEEGIDLQQHTRYVLHYDVEWNPAKMEQREGRVDREGRRTSGDGAVRVNFFLLKDTYEERIFHTVMQRDAWFQIMIGSKRNELAKDMRVEGAESDGPTEDVVTDDRSRLTSDERAAVMLDLRP